MFARCVVLCALLGCGPAAEPAAKMTSTPSNELDQARLRALGYL